MGCILCARKDPGFDRCGHCGSLPRHRALAWLFTRISIPAGAKVLEVGPAPCQLQFFVPLLQGARYTAVDIIPPSSAASLQAPHRFLEMEMTRLTFSDQSFDFIVANHVLSFIRSDYQAMSQVHRCLKTQGVAFLGAEVRLPKTMKAYEMSLAEPDVYTEEFRREWGSEWVYGMDYFERLEAAGFFPHRLDVASLAGAEVSAAQGFDRETDLTLCFKFRDAGEKFLEAL